MSKGRRRKRSGWCHPVNVNRTRRRWKLRKRAHAVGWRLGLLEARARDADEDLDDFR